MKLYLVQHGDAVDKSVDADRPLSVSGARDVQAVAAVLAASGVHPERVFHSGKTRARQTAEILVSKLDVSSGASEIAGIAPMDSVAALSRRLSEWQGATMLCGHQPFMGKLVSHLLVNDEGKGLVTYAPGSVACLEGEPGGDWALVWFLRPELCRIN